MMKRLLICSFQLFFVLSYTFAQVWDYQSDFTIQPQPHGIVIDNEGKIWLGFYSSTDTIPNPSGTKQVPIRPIWIYNADGTPALFSPIRFVTINGKTDTLKSGCRGISLDHNGNILYNAYDTMWRINYLTGKGMNKVTPLASSSLTEAAVDQNGFIYLGHVVSGKPSYIFDENFDYHNSIDSTFIGLQRSLVVSADGKDLYLGKMYSGRNGIVHYHSDDGPHGVYVKVDTFGTTPTKAMMVQCLDMDRNGLLWAGTYWDVPANDFNGWYALDPFQNFAIVDSIGQCAGRYSIGAIPEDGTFFSPRGAAWSLDGKTMYTADFDGGIIKKWYNPNPIKPRGAFSKLYISPDTLVFANVVKEKKETKSIAIKNIGNSDLTLNTPILIGSDSQMFSFCISSLTIKPNSNVNLFVTFYPSEVGNYTANIEFTSTGGDTTITLIGHAVDRPDLYKPWIHSITDTPNDQGKQVIIQWERSKFDSLGSDTVITQYAVWRRLDMNTSSSSSQGQSAASLSLKDGTQGDYEIKTVSSFADMINNTQSTIPGTKFIIKLKQYSQNLKKNSDSNDFWTFISVCPAIQYHDYSYVAPTLFDSTENGVTWTTFFISAHTTNPQLWFASMPDSGFSIDNLAPASPIGISTNLQQDGIKLEWEASLEEDLKFYAIYRGTEKNFQPENPLFFTTDNYYLDKTVSFDKAYYYRITATDFSGNESEYSQETFCYVTNLDDPNRMPTEYRLEQNYPNPFNPQTTIRFGLPEDGQAQLMIFNMQGRLVKTLVHGLKAAGMYNQTWNGTDDQGRPVSSGVYIYQLKTETYSQNKKMLLIR